MLLVVTSVIGTLLVDCIVDVVSLLDFEDDVSAFGFKETELSAPFVVLVPSNEMLELLVFVSCVVIGLESELAVEVFGKDVGEDCSEAVKDATLLAVI